MRVQHASQKLLQDSGESIFAARHLDVSQDALGRHCCENWRVPTPPGAKSLVAESALGGLRSLAWQGVSSLLEIPTDSSQCSLVGKALLATRGLAPGG